MFEVQRRYPAIVTERAASRVPEGYAALGGRCGASRRRCGCTRTRSCPCHNDLLAANFLDDGGDLRIIDYEYSGTNEAAFELGNLVNESQLDRDHLVELVEAYHGRVTTRLLARAELWGLAGRYAWTLWGAIQHGVSDLDHDFWDFATERFEPAAAPADEPLVSTDLPRDGRGCRTAVRGDAAPCPGPGRRHRRRCIGCSVAYHLAHLGWTDVLVLEQGSLSCGTTWHAAGLVGQLRATEASTRLVQYSTELYSRLEAETGLGTGYRVCGGLTVARTPERMVALRRTVASAAAYDLECELLTPSEAHERYPLIQVDDVLGAIWLPGDGRANPTDLTQSLAKGAAQRGGPRSSSGCG